MGLNHIGLAAGSAMGRDRSRATSKATSAGTMPWDNKAMGYSRIWRAIVLASRERRSPPEISSRLGKQ